MSHDAPLFVTTTPTSQKHPDYKNTLVKSVEGLTSRPAGRGDRRDYRTQRRTQRLEALCVCVCVCVCVQTSESFIGKFFSRISFHMFLILITLFWVVLYSEPLRSMLAPGLLTISRFLKPAKTSLCFCSLFLCVSHSSPWTTSISSTWDIHKTSNDILN